MGTKIIFHCGAEIKAKSDKETLRNHFSETAIENKRDKNDIRVIVFDTESESQRPRFEDETSANCLGCPCRRAAKRKHDKCFSEKGKPIRHVITCQVSEMVDFEWSEENV